MLNVIDQATIERRLGRIQEQLAEVELFLAGNPVSVIRIKDASITDAQIADLSITNVKFADVAITNAKITSVDATKFTAGTLNAARIAAGTITASKLNVSTLSAITANVGTITAGSITSVTITGGTIRTASSGTRAEMTASPNALILYDGSTERFRFDPDALKMNNASFHWMNSDFTTFYASHFRSGNNVYLQAGSGLDLNIIQGTSGGDIQLVAADGEINVWPGGSGTTYVNGSIKTAIVPTRQGYKALYCLEAPDVWFFDFASSIDSISKTFLEVTEGEQNILETDQGEVLVFRKRKGMGDARFASKTIEQFNRNNQFWGAV